MKQEYICILSSFKDTEKQSLGRCIKSINKGVYIETSLYQPSCDYIVCKVPSRGEKFLCGAIAGKPLVTHAYITACKQQNTWLDPRPFEWANQKPAGVDLRLINLPNKCKDFAQKNGGKLLFSDWRVLLHVQKTVSRNAYKRLLLSGGATIVQATPPFSRETTLSLTHVFVTKDSLKDVVCLQPFRNILLPEYIAEYAIMDKPPNIAQFSLFATNASATTSSRKRAKPQSPYKSPYKSPKKRSTWMRKDQPTIIQLFSRKLKTQTLSPHKNQPPAIEIESKESANSSTESAKVAKNILPTETATIVRSPEKLKDRPGKVPEKSKSNLEISVEKQVKKDNMIVISSDDSLENCPPNIDFTDLTTPFMNLAKTSIVIEDSPENTPAHRDEEKIAAHQDENTPAYQGENCDLHKNTTAQPRENVVVHFGEGTSLDYKKKPAKNFLAHRDDKISELCEKTNVANNSFAPADQDTFGENSELQFNINKNTGQPSEDITKDSTIKCIAVIENVAEIEDVEMLESTQESDSDIKMIDTFAEVKNVSSALLGECEDVNKPPSGKVKNENKSLLAENNDVKKSGETKYVNKSLLGEEQTHTVVKKVIEKVVEEVVEKTSTEVLEKIFKENVENLAINENATDIDKQNNNEANKHVVVKNDNNKCEQSNTQSKEVTKENRTSHYFKEHLLVFDDSRDNKKYQSRAPFPTRVENVLESTDDDNTYKKTLTSVKQNLSSFRYPTAKVLYMLISRLQSETKTSTCANIYALLHHVALLHPDIWAVYTLTLQRPVTEKDESVTGTVTCWQYLLDLLSELAGSVCKDEESDIEEKKSMEGQFFVLEYICSLMDCELSKIFKSDNSSTEVKLLRKSLTWQIFWSSGLEATHNVNVKALVSFTLDLAATTQLDDARQQRLMTLSLGLLRLVAECLSVCDLLHESTRLRTALATDLQARYEQSLGKAPPEVRSSFMHQLKPAWLALRLADFQLQKYKCSPEHAAWAKKPLSFEKLINHYFFLFPNQSGMNCKEGRKKRGKPKRESKSGGKATNPSNNPSATVEDYLRLLNVLASRLVPHKPRLDEMRAKCVMLDTHVTNISQIKTLKMKVLLKSLFSTLESRYTIL